MVTDILGAPGSWLIEALASWLGLLGGLIVAMIIVRAAAFPLAYRQAWAIRQLAGIRDEVAAVDAAEADAPADDEAAVARQEADRQARQVAIYQRAGVGPFTPALAGVGQALIVSLVVMGAARVAREEGGVWLMDIESWTHGWWWVAAGAITALVAGIVGVLRLGGRLGITGLIVVSAFPAALVVMGSFLPSAVMVTTVVAAIISLVQAIAWWWLIGPVREARPTPEQSSQ